MSELSLRFPDELVRAIAAETARLLRDDGLASSPWYDVAGAAAYLRIPEGRLRNLTAARQVRYSPQGKGYIYHRDWLDDFARRQVEG